MGSSDEDTNRRENADAAILVATALRALLAACVELDAVQRRQLSLGVSEQRVLTLLAAGMTAPTQLSQSVGMSTAGMTSVLDRLEQDALILRTPHATDGRRVLITLTKKGLLARASFDPVDTEVLAHTEALPADHAQLIARFLSDAAASVAQRAAGAPACATRSPSSASATTGPCA